MSPELITGCLTKFESHDVSREDLERYNGIVAGRKPYIICFTPRSGSSYLADLLTSSESLGAPGEYLNADLMDLTLQHMRAAGYAGRSLIDYLSWLMQNLSSANGVFGFKVSYFDWQPLIACGLDKVLFGGFKPMFLYRRNILKQAVSLYVATETNLFHTNVPIAEETRRRAATLPYDPEKIRNWIQHIWIQEGAWRDYLRGRDFLELDYDVVSDDAGSVVSAIARFLAVDLAQDRDAKASVFEKVRTANNDRLVVTFLEDPANRTFLKGMLLEESRFAGQ
ncbi:MAG: Stf0 family sulfotransferase [Proteobacteria bacterium]|nr:Stf0 family sulfotransferase [Pseudomonadota bacterium]